MSCEVCGLTTNLKSCGQCLKVNYCSREHQVAHWKEHRQWCNKNSTTNNTVGNRHVASSSSSSSDDLIVPSNQAFCEQSKFYNSDSNEAKETNRVDSTILCSTNFTQENVSLRRNKAPSAIIDLNSQICPSMASLRVCDSSKPNYAANTSSSENVINAFEMPSQITKNNDQVFNNLNTYCQIILKDMNQYGFCVIDNFLQSGDAILSEVNNLYDKGLFRAGQVVNNRANSNSKLIRGDQIIWVEGNEPICNNIGFLVRILDSIVSKCNTTMSSGEFLKYNINRRTKAMIACYPGNYTKYVRHIDNPNSDGRCITSIYYLNKDYDRQKDGGVLRLFPQMNDGIVADIEPKFNRVIFFWSDRRNPHEVMPSARKRFAITVWYFDANERAKAIQKYKENSIQCPNDKDLAPF